MTIRTRSRLSVGIRAGLLFVILIGVAGGSHPPIHAQTQYERMRQEQELSDRVTDLTRRVEHVETAIESQIKINESLAKLESDGSAERKHDQGVVEGIGAVLSLLGVVSITIQVRKKP